VRALGLDVGSKTIGVAISDELGMTANPVTTLTRRGTRQDVPAIVALCVERGVEVVVAGLPLALEGAETPRSRQIRTLCAELEAALAAAGLATRVELWDERFSTVAAERTLIEADLSRARRKQVIDRAAAAFILQGWLDGRINRGLLE
jgi:putative Holliday junction resolvase